jgi:predicted nucleic acid-binding protein
VIVVDASVLATALGDNDEDGAKARAALTGETLWAPEIIDLEVASVWRGQLRAGQLTEQRARQALADLADVELTRAPHQPLMDRIWELRGNLSTYDAAYVALAEELEATLLTGDRRLSRAPGLRCEVAVLA